MNDNNFFQLNKYYSMYNNMDRRQLENVVVRNMILKDKRFDMIKGQIPEDLYNRLMNRKSRIVEEEKKMKINMVKKMCIVNSDEEMVQCLSHLTSASHLDGCDIDDLAL